MARQIYKHTLNEDVEVTASVDSAGHVWGHLIATVRDDVDDCIPVLLSDEEMDDLANALLRAASLMRHERVVLSQSNG